LFAERFAVTTDAQNMLKRFQRGEGALGRGQVPPLALACGHPWKSIDITELQSRRGDNVGDGDGDDWCVTASVCQCPVFQDGMERLGPAGGS